MLKRVLMLCCALVIAWLFPLPSMGAGTTIVVNTTIDGIVTDRLCSLREAIVAANTDADCAGCPGGSGADVIEFDPSLPVPSVFLYLVIKFLTNTNRQNWMCKLVVASSHTPVIPRSNTASNTVPVYSLLIIIID